MAVSRQLEKKFLKNIHFWWKGSEKFLFSFDDFSDFFTQFFQSNKKYIYVHLMKINFDWGTFQIPVPMSKNGQDAPGFAIIILICNMYCV